jgi:ATP synthase subunit D
VAGSGQAGSSRSTASPGSGSRATGPTAGASTAGCEDRATRTSTYTACSPDSSGGRRGCGPITRWPRKRRNCVSRPTGVARSGRPRSTMRTPGSCVLSSSEDRTPFVAPREQHPVNASLQVETAMGLSYPVDATLSPALGSPYLPGTAAVVPAVAAFRTALLAAVRTAAAEEAVRRVEAETVTTRRRLCALEKRWLPQLQQALAALELSLEQGEQEDTMRLRHGLPPSPTARPHHDRAGAARGGRLSDIPGRRARGGRAGGGRRRPAPRSPREREPRPRRHSGDGHRTARGPGAQKAVRGRAAHQGRRAGRGRRGRGGGTCRSSSSARTTCTRWARHWIGRSRSPTSR